MCQSYDTYIAIYQCMQVWVNHPSLSLPPSPPPPTKIMRITKVLLFSHNPYPSQAMKPCQLSPVLSFIMHGVHVLGICEEFKELKLFLECHNKLLSKNYSDQGSLYKTMQSTIRGSADTALKYLSPQVVRNQMWYLCYKSFDVPSELCEWTMQEIEKMCNKSVEAVEKPDPGPPSCEDKKPLMNKDSLYHAGLCCQAVSTRTAANFKKFFRGVGHTLDEVSMSISQDKENVDRYIIAKQGDVVYMAFQSEPTLSKWINSSYGSFDNGMVVHII